MCIFNERDENGQTLHTVDNSYKESLFLNNRQETSAKYHGYMANQHFHHLIYGSLNDYLTGEELTVVT